MAKTDVLDILRAKKMDPFEFNFESLWIPPMHFYLTPQDVEALRQIATSARLSSKIQQKYDMIDNIMRNRGFKRFSAGTNRVVYRFLEDNRFLVKIAVDKVGMQDNPLEYKNQFLLQPFVTKMFYVSPCGTVGFSERVLPVKNKEEFREIASDVFDILVNKILGLYVVEDVGTKYFMNWGIRMGFGPVLLDYPYVYELDGNKLFCTWENPMTRVICDGEIDYDEGFNHLICTRCGKRYLATNLRDDTVDNKIVIRKGGNEMRVFIKKGDRIIGEPIPIDEVITPPSRPVKYGSDTLVVTVNRPGQPTEIVQTEVQNLNVYVEPEQSSEDAMVLKDKEVIPQSANVKIPQEITENNSTNVSAIDQNIDVATEVVASLTTGKGEDLATTEDTDDINKANVEVDKYPNTNIEDDEEDIVLASDVDIGKKYQQPSQIRARNEKGQFISTGNGTNKKKKGKNKSKRASFIPSGTLYTNDES